METLGVNGNFNISNYSHSDAVNNAGRKYKNHPSVKEIRKTITVTSTFHFSDVDKIDVEKLIGNLNFSKVGTFKNIPTKCLKVTSDICSTFLVTICNQELILNKKTHTKIKATDITTVYKKKDLRKVNKYRTVTVLPTV